MKDWFLTYIVIGIHSYKPNDFKGSFPLHILYYRIPINFLQTKGGLEFNFTLIMTSLSLLHPHSHLLFIIVPLTFSHACMHTQYQSALSIAHMQSFSLGRSPMHAHTHPLPIISGIFISHVHVQRSMFLYVCVYIARSFPVFHTNRSIYISSEVSPSFPRTHQSIYTYLYIGLHS